MKLIYRSGKSNTDADGLFMHPLQDVELFPDAVKAVCQANLVERESCPLVETLVISNAVTLVDPPKIVSEYDQEIPQSQTADNPVAPRGRATQPSGDTRKTN